MKDIREIERERVREREGERRGGEDEVENDGYEEKMRTYTEKYEGKQDRSMLGGKFK